MNWNFHNGLWAGGRVLQRFGRAALLAVAATTSVAVAPSVQAQSAGTIVVGNDRGGFIRARLAEIRRIRAMKQRVEIRGRVCFSTCTMYLGVEDLCVSPATTFGFHGPGMAIGRMSAAQFDYVSRVIASHYPPSVADWYMREGRTRTSGLYREVVAGFRTSC